MQNVRPRNKEVCKYAYICLLNGKGFRTKIEKFLGYGLRSIPSPEFHILQSAAQNSGPAICTADFSQIKLISPKLIQRMASFPNIKIFTPLWEFVLLNNFLFTCHNESLLTTFKYSNLNNDRNVARKKEVALRWFCNVMLYGELQWNSRTSKSELDHPMHGLWWAISSYPLK